MSSFTFLADYAKLYVTELSKPKVGAMWIGRMSGDEYIDLVVFTVDHSVIYQNNQNKWSTSGSIIFKI